jgi:hypothetical protein
MSIPSLHPPVLKTPAQRALVVGQLASVAQARAQSMAIAGRSLAPPGTLHIPLTTVSLSSNFDAYIDIRFHGQPDTSRTSLLVDSGNFSLIVPDYNVIAALPNFSTDYEILADSTHEPWGCPAKILRGPIEIPTQSGVVYEIPNCEFYACTDTNSGGDLTYNFGMGWISPGIPDRDTGIVLKAPVTYNASFPYAEFNYAPAATIMAAASQPNVVGGSSLTLYQNMPTTGYQVFDILRNQPWMSLTPRSLTIGNTNTGWPGNLSSPIALIDTGGGPVFLSDPNGDVYSATWPEGVPNPPWTSDNPPQSISCQSVKDELTVVIGDENNSFSYRIDTTNMPSPVQGLTLVMCEECGYMFGYQGMNIGGLSALFNYIVIDYELGKVGLKSKSPALV